jgi:hypothetical protein
MQLIHGEQRDCQVELRIQTPNLPRFCSIAFRIPKKIASSIEPAKRFKTDISQMKLVGS